MKEDGMKEREMDMECSLKEPEITSRDIGSMTSDKVRDLIISVIKESYLLANGLTISLRVEFTQKLKTNKLKGQKLE